MGAESLEEQVARLVKKQDTLAWRHIQLRLAHENVLLLFDRTLDDLLALDILPSQTRFNLSEIKDLLSQVKVTRDPQD